MDSKELDYIKTAIEIFKQQKVLDRPMNFIDIGANHGRYSEAFYEQAKSANQKVQIFMIEPVEELHIKVLIQKAMFINAMPYCFGIANTDEVKHPMHIIRSENENETGLSSLHNRPVFGGFKHEVKMVNVMKLDYFIEKIIKQDIIDFIKIDVEGGEYDVLLSAENSLREQKIRAIQFEYGGTYEDAGTTLERVIEYLNHFGYNVYDSVYGVLVNINHGFKEDFGYNNFMAIPMKDGNRFNQK